jgi:hypothetical protein
VWVEIAEGDGWNEPREVYLDDEYCGSTLHAACEEAVRAVDPFVNDYSGALEHPLNVSGNTPL